MSGEGKSLGVSVSPKLVAESLHPVLRKLSDSMIEEIEIDSDEEREVFIDVLHKVGEVEKELKERKDFIFKPWRELQKNINAMFFDGPEKQAAELKARVKRAIAAYDTAKEEAIQRALAEAQTTKVTMLDAPRAPSRPTYGGGSGLAKKTTWTAEIVSFAELPDSFKLVNERALRALTVGVGEKKPPDVPGVKWVKGTTVQASKKSLASDSDDL